MSIERAFTESLHPRGTGAQGGQFVAGGGAKAGPRTPARKAAGRTLRKPGGMSFDGKRGTGYGVKGGDKRVKTLQTALNRLGLTDGAGKRLVVDGKLGPRTTAAIKKAQRKLGLKADGVVTPALLRQLTTAKGLEKPRKAAPAKKSTPAKKAASAPARKAAPVRAPNRRYGGERRAPVTMARTVSYSERMADFLARHGTHNQKSHGNRLGRPENVAGKTGLAKAAGIVAQQPEQGPAAPPVRDARIGTSDVRLDDRVSIRPNDAFSGARHVGAGREGQIVSLEGDNGGYRWWVEFDDGKTEVWDRRNLSVVKTGDELHEEDMRQMEAEEVAATPKSFSARDVQAILNPDNRPHGSGRKVSEHKRMLMEAGATEDQAREILKGLHVKDPDSDWDTKDVSYSTFFNAKAEAEAEAASKRKESLAMATPQAYMRLLGTDGRPALVKSKPVAKVFEAMQANGWKITAADGHGSFTFSSPDESRQIRVLAINGVSIYDHRHNKISGVKALAHVEGRT